MPKKLHQKIANTKTFQNHSRHRNEKQTHTIFCCYLDTNEITERKSTKRQKLNTICKHLHINFSNIGLCIDCTPSAVLSHSQNPLTRFLSHSRSLLTRNIVSINWLKEIFPHIDCVCRVSISHCTHTIILSLSLLLHSLHSRLKWIKWWIVVPSLCHIHTLTFDTNGK